MTRLNIPIGKPKRAIVEMAFEDCAIAGFQFEVTPEEMTTGVRRLDAMMAVWPFSALAYERGGTPEDASGLEDGAEDVVAMHLALRLAPSMGKALAAEQRAALARAYSLLCARVATPVADAALPAGTLRGTGSRRRW